MVVGWCCWCPMRACRVPRSVLSEDHAVIVEAGVLIAAVAVWLVIRRR